MKKLIIGLFLFAMSIAALQAQRNSFYIGANGGVNLSKFKFTEDLAELYPSSKTLFGLNGGFTVGMEIENFTLSSGIQYVQKGSIYETDNFEDEQGIGFFSANERLHFISIPLLFGYRSYLADGFGFTIAMGPSFNLGLGGRIDEEIEYFGSEKVETENYTVRFGNSVNDDYRKMQMGFQISPGMVFTLNDRSKLTFNATWDVGLADSFNKRYKDANQFFETYKGNQLNRSTMFTIGYEHHFSLGDRY